MSEDHINEYMKKYDYFYVDNLNQLLKDADYMLKSEKYGQVSELANEIRYNMGGFKNYYFYWASLCPQKVEGLTHPD